MKKKEHTLFIVDKSTTWWIRMVGFWKRKLVPAMSLVLCHGLALQQRTKDALSHNRSPAAPVLVSVCFVLCQFAQLYAGYRSPMHCHIHTATAKAAPQRKENKSHSIIRGHDNNCTGGIFHRTLRILLNTELLQVNFNYSPNSKKRNKTIKQRKDLGDFKLKIVTVRFAC